MNNEDVEMSIAKFTDLKQERSKIIKNNPDSFLVNVSFEFQDVAVEVMKLYLSASKVMPKLVQEYPSMDKASNGVDWNRGYNQAIRLCTSHLVQQLDGLEQVLEKAENGDGKLRSAKEWKKFTADAIRAHITK